MLSIQVHIYIHTQNNLNRFSTTSLLSGQTKPTNKKINQKDKINIDFDFEGRQRHVCVISIYRRRQDRLNRNRMAQ